MSIKFTPTLEDQFRSMRLGSREEDSLLEDLDVSNGIISRDKQSSSTLGSTASKLTRVVKEAFIDGDDEEIQPLMRFDEPEAALISREIIDSKVQVLSEEATRTISIEQLRILQQKYPYVTEAVFSTMIRKPKEIFDVTSWVHLKKLSLEVFSLTKQELKILCQSKSINHLSLDFADRVLTSLEWGYIAALENLESLTLRRCPSSDRKIIKLLKGCKKLKHFTLMACQGVSPDILKKISSCIQLVTLQLQLWDERQEHTLESLEGFRNLEGFKLFGKCSNVQSLGSLKNLKNLSLNASDITDEQLTEIVIHLPHLKILSLDKCRKIGDKAVVAIGEHLRGLESLSLSCCWDIQELSPLASMKNLKGLNLSSCFRITNLFVLTYLCELEYLNLNHLSLSDFSLITVLKNLRNLHLSFCDMTDLPSLRELKKLEYLNVIQSFHKKVLDLRLIPIDSENFKQLVVSQDDTMKHDTTLAPQLKEKIITEYTSSRYRDYM